ncbi:MAG: DUF433 domain-containing protein [Pseudonocardiales bacterium]
MGKIVSLLERPVYTYREVDRLLGLNPDTAKRWINGYRRHGRNYDPIVREQPTDATWVTWGEFIETRLLSEYRDVNEIKIIRMRRVATTLREYYHRRYPLAYSRPFVTVEDRQVLARVQEETGLDSQVWMVVDTGQYALSPRTDRFFQATTYGPDPDATGQDDDHVAIEVTIDPRYPDVKLNPLLRSGRPTVAGHNIHIATLAGMVLDGDPVSKVADWYELAEDQVQQAVDFTVTHNLAS